MYDTPFIESKERCGICGEAAHIPEQLLPHLHCQEDAKKIWSHFVRYGILITPRECQKTTRLAAISDTWEM